MTINDLLASVEATDTARATAQEALRAASSTDGGWQGFILLASILTLCAVMVAIGLSGKIQGSR